MLRRGLETLTKQGQESIAALEKGGEAEREIRGSGVEDLEPSERGERDRFTFLN